MSAETFAQLEVLTRKFHDACIAVHDSTAGHCREASLVLVEALLAVDGIDGACVCQGTYQERATIG